MRRVVITGLGCLSAIGNGVDATWRNAVRAIGGIKEVDIAAEGQPELVVKAAVARVDIDLATQLNARFSRKLVANADRFANLAVAATAEALDDAGLAAGEQRLEQAAIIYGCASMGHGAIEACYQRLFDRRDHDVHPRTVPRVMGSAAASQLSMLFGVRGLCFTVNSACASSAHAISEGMHLIRSGRAETAIVGGSDASLTYGSLQAWRSLRAISPQTCRPFSAGRDGTILGEGAATLVLEEEEGARRRGAHIYAELAGSGANADAAHMTQPDWERAAAAVRAAHEDARLPTDVPLLISAHGTATPLNDNMEAKVLHQVYGERLTQSRVLATKSAHGHMLGASAAMELLLVTLAMVRGQAPAILNYLAPDPECCLPLVLETEPVRYRAAMSTSFAFGGLNCALVVRLG